MEPQQNILSPELELDSRVLGHLRETAGWARFLGIVGYVFAALLAVFAFMLPALLSSSKYGGLTRNQSAEITGLMTTSITLVYLLAAAVLFLIAYFTFKFGSKIRTAIATTDHDSMDKGFMHLKFLFRFYGILMIMWLGLVILALLLGGLGAAMSR